MENKEFFEIMRNNIINITERFSMELDKTFFGLNSLLYDGEMEEFVVKQGFTQVSSSIANKRHVTWRKILKDLGIPTEYHDTSDLISLIVDPYIEVKGSASLTSRYGNWQGGKKYKIRLDKRVFLLSQECYDLKDGLEKLKITIAYISGSMFRSVGKTTNRTILSSNDLKGSVITSYEI